MTLTLDIVSRDVPVDQDATGTFATDGGTIGRNADSTWVLAHPKVSGRHALIRHRGGVFYIEDSSRNGIGFNHPSDRLDKGREYPLSDGDVLFIDPYEIRVSVQRRQARPSGGEDPFAPHARESVDPFARSPEYPAARPQGVRANPYDGQDPGDVVDPMRMFGPADQPRAKGPTAQDLERGELLAQHFKPPVVADEPSASPRRAAPDLPPDGYDPMARDSQILNAPTPLAPASPQPPRPRWTPPSAPTARPTPPPPPPQAHRAPQGLPNVSAPPAVPPAGRTPDLPPVPRAEAVNVGPPAAATSELAAVLAGAGLDPALATPELARQLGAILRTVVVGVMDVLHARAEVKDAFDLKRTVFRPVENNPLKFSANVEDALHNLLVKRNPAYLGPVDAFEDAFADLREHQIAMLAGIRVAFEGLLAEFDPDRLQAEFDRVGGKGLVPAKLRYWEQYRDRLQGLIRDPDTSFRRLFAEAFARAYAEQLRAVERRPDASEDTAAFRAPRDDEG